jgi:hypothetical protein
MLEADRNGRRLLWLGLIVLLVAATGRVAWQYLWHWPDPDTPDDAFMFVRYVDNLFRTGRLSWNMGGHPTWGLTGVGYIFMLAPVRLLVSNPAYAVVTASLLSFVAFAALLVVYCWRCLRAGAEMRAVITLGLLAALTVEDSLFIHATSGMDTMFAMAYVMVVLLVNRHAEAAPTPGSGVLAGSVGGLCFLVRPDLLLFGLGAPLGIAVLAPEPRQRRCGRIAVSVAIIIAGFGVLLAEAYFGHPFPLPFYAKSGHIYGPAFEHVYMVKGMRELRNFLVGCWPLLVITVAGWRSWKKVLGVTERAAIVSSGVFIVYYAGFTLQIMGNDFRFYMPILPVLAVCAGQILADWLERVPQLNPSISVLAGFFVVLILAASTGVWTLTRAGRVRSIDESKNLLTFMQWRQLPNLERAVPEGIRIAATEVGRLGLLAPRSEIIDLAGLNTPEYAMRKFSPDILFADPPDLIYEPVADYVDMVADLKKHPMYGSDYELVPSRGEWMDVRLYKKGRHYAALRNLMLGPSPTDDAGRPFEVRFTERYE